MPNPSSPYRTVALMALMVSLIMSMGTGLIGSAAPARQAAYTDQIDAYMQAQMQAYDIPGAALVIVRDGQVEYQRGYGVANDQGEPVSPDTPFLLASVSKSFTALGVMQLVEAGKIRLDDPVRKYIPWFNVAGGGDAITVAQLLYQKSGLTELAGVRATLQPDGPDALELGVRKLAGDRLAASPGSHWDYSNLNYDVLGLLIQQVSGQPFEAYIQEHIFNPLEMGHSYTSLAAARAGGAASGYVQFFGRPLDYDRWMLYSRATLPAAGLWSSASDLGHYLIAQLDGGRYEGVELLSPAGIQTLHQPGTWFKNGGGYSMGWFFWPSFLDPRYQPEEGPTYTNLPTVYHDGDWANYKTVVLMLPSQDYGLALLMNSNDLPIRSAFTYFAWDLTLIATGGEPQFFHPREDFFLQYSRWLAAGLVLILLLELLLAVRALTKMRAQKYQVDFSTGKLFLLAGLPLLFDTSLIIFFFWGLFPRHAVDLPVVVRTMPDLGLLSVLALLLVVVWGGLRSLWYLRAWELARWTRR